MPAIRAGRRWGRLRARAAAAGCRGRVHVAVSTRRPAANRASGVVVWSGSAVRLTRKGCGDGVGRFSWG